MTPAHDDDAPSLSEADLDAVANRVFEKLQAQIGRSTVRVVVWLIATGATAVLVWLGILPHSNGTH